MPLKSKAGGPQTPQTIMTQNKKFSPGMVITAGFINGAASRTITAPFDRLRAVLATGRETRMVAACKTIMRTQGVVGFWSSNLANVVQCGPENAIAFTMFQLLKPHLCKDAEAPTVPEKFLLGSVAGSIAMTAVYPLYVVQNRMAAAHAGQYNGMFDCMRHTANGGRQSLYAGFTVSLIRVVPLKGIMLGGYATLKDWWGKDPSTGEITTTRALACSAAAGGVAHAITYPMHLARTVQMQPEGRQFNSWIEVLGQRLKVRGFRGWFAGLPMWLCNRIPAVAIEFAVNERALDALAKVWVF